MGVSWRDTAHSRRGPDPNCARPGSSTRATVDAFAEWLDGCDGARLGRATWVGDNARVEHVLLAWRQAAAARGLWVDRLDGVLALLDARGTARLQERPLVIVEACARSGRSPFDWLRLGLARGAIAGLVARAAAPAHWPTLVLGDPPPGHPSPALVAADPAGRWHRGATGDGVRRRAAAAHPALGAVGEPRAGPVLGSLSRRARGHEIAALAAWRDGRWRVSSSRLHRAVRQWLAAGVPHAAVRAALRLARVRVWLGDEIGADQLAACAEIAATLVARHRAAAARVADAVVRAREEACRRAWVPGAVTGSEVSAPRDPACAAWVPAAGSRAGGAVDDELIEVLQAGHHEEEYPAIARVCSVVRDRLGASAVAVVALGEPAPLAGAGHVPLASDDLVRKAMSTAAEISPTPGRSGVEAAVPVRFAGAPVGVLCCRWGANARVNEPRARMLLAAAASVCAPNLHALLNRRPLRHDEDESLGLLGVSAAIRRVRESIRRAAVVPYPVLVEGESGSGKELVARAIHRASARRRRQLCAINCAAISDELFEAEVFGHARGAFTGALTDRPGLFEEADGGTLFLDEIAELSLRGQAKLLRVLQEGEVRRLGENLARRVDVRLVAATNRPLEREAASGRFRQDLRFRLDVVRIAVPPLRERAEDVPLLADHFWRQALERTGGRARLDEATVDLLARYQWPGNVRELQNLMATLAVRAPARGRVRPSDLPFHVTTATPESGSLDQARRHFDARFVRATLARCGGRRGEAARRLGMSRQGLAKLLARLGLDAEVPPGES